ncbi:M14 family zinc carboxypeptidase [Pseudoalteromonas luteoviolacea]|uniref:Zinc carboxypeptidase n=1 Tax=Pseudoalteromonas luteoviolacea (strain 2ta16) TaxID=1353533 RepID=V4HRV5_PSEL2|nr:M14 family zinc carboxypeptidase [Pseudoalteromonas luteoviolacea]ESP90654.1 Zinc carboxypeptidase [Pseudoalteromonas luteoviolacea 2ta16]KZN41770.1 hypothetical protein N483_13955 [Pseudoalteromonas luteoviolacea NCIMB 1944]
MNKNIIKAGVLSALSMVTTSAYTHNQKTPEQALNLQTNQSNYLLYFDSPEQKAHYSGLYHEQIIDASHNAFKLSLSKAEYRTILQTGVIIVEQNVAESFAAPALPKTKKSMSITPSSGAEELTSIPNFPCYPTVEETHKRAQQLAEKYPDFVELKTIGPSWEKSQGIGGYDLNVLVLKNKKRNKNKQLPALFMQSVLHAREYTPGATTLRLAEHLLENRKTDADIHWILNQREIHILLIANPDGRKYAEQGLFWRKNTNASYCAQSEQNRGVDLNRNFDFAWATTSGSTDEQCASKFHGPSPASEPETQAIQAYVKALFGDNRGDALNDAAPLDTPGVFIDIHSYSRFVMWPWSHETTPPPNAAGLSMLGHRMAAYNDYLALQVSEQFNGGGSAEGYAYGELGVAAYTFELGSTFFENCSNFEGEILPNNLQALIYAAKVAKKPYKLSGGPKIVDFRLEGAGETAVPAGTSINLIADVHDDAFGPSLSGVAPPSQAIKKVRMTVRKQGEGRIQRLILPPVDGIYDSPREKINYALDTSDWDDGRYTVIIKAQDTTGQWGVKYAKYLTIDDDASEQNQAPIANFTPNCTFGACKFDASNSIDDKAGLKYRWYISNDATQFEYFGKQIEFVNQRAGTYTIALEIEDANGVRANKEVVMELQGTVPPIAKLTYQCNGLTCEFDSSGSTDADGQIVRRLWRIGSDDGFADGDVKVTRTFPAPGEYIVSVVVLDNHDEYSQVIETITVK